MPEGSLEEFIAAKVHTVEEVEIILLLSRSPDTLWTADAMAQQLGLKPEIVATRCRELVRRGLLKSGDTGAYRYSPADEELKDQVTRLLSAYANQRISVINAIYSANLTRLRSFADAFKLGGGGNT